jgi:AraC family transcriptional regulator, positive regulator of tynA and feaB
MPQLETFSTAELPPHRRLDFWNDLTGSAFTPLLVDPVDRRAFVGALTRTEIGAIRLAEARSDAATVRHTKQHVSRSREALFLLCLQLDGISINRQQGRESTLHYGDFNLLDSSRPYEISFPQTNRSLVLSIPHPELLRRMPNPESYVGVAMSGRSGVAGLLSSLICNFWQQRRGGDETFLSPRFSEAIMDLIASAYAGIAAAAPDNSSITIARREQIRSYIEGHLHDPSLTPGSVASAVHLSPRRLHQLFEADGETVGAYILRRRLEECARAMSDASQRSRTVTEIAFLHGFNNASHFGRVFRERYNSTPSDYRRRAIAA